LNVKQNFKAVLTVFCVRCFLTCPCRGFLLRC